MVHHPAAQGIDDLAAESGLSTAAMTFNTRGYAVIPALLGDQDQALAREQVLAFYRDNVESLIGER